MSLSLIFTSVTRCRAVLVITALLSILSACSGEGDGSKSLVAKPGSSTSSSSSSSNSSSSGSTSGSSSSSSSGSSGPPPVFKTASIVLNTQLISNLSGMLQTNHAAAIRFKDIVDLQLASGGVYGFEQWFAALMYQLTEEPQYCRYAVANIDEFVRGEEALINSGQRAEVSGDSYLHSGGTIGDIALVRDWCSSFLTGDMVRRWRDYADQTVYNIWNPTSASWGGVTHTWSGWSVDNPYNNYYYSFLEATMLTGLAFKNDGLTLGAQGKWEDIFFTTKITNQLIPIFNTELVGGGSREGTGYGSSLRDLYRLFDWWRQSGGTDITTLTDHVLENSYYMVHALMPTGDYLVPFGDHARDSSAAFFDYHRTLMLESAFLHPQEAISGVVKTQLANSSVTRQYHRFNFVYDFLYALDDIPAQQPDILNDSYFAVGTGHLFSRTNWTANAAHFSTTIGPFTESHDHRDKGGFYLYKNEWLAYDQQINTHSGIRAEEEFHNIVRIVDQTTNETVTTTWDAPAPNIFGMTNTTNWLWVAVDTKPIYDYTSPRHSQKLDEARREMVFIKEGALVVLDKVTDNTASDTRKIWQLNTPFSPTVNGNNYLMQGGASSLELIPLLPNNSTKSIVSYSGMTDMVSRYTDAAGNTTTGYRIEISSTDAQAYFLNVLDIDGLINNASVSENTAEYVLTINFYGGTTYTIRFNKNTMGGSLQENASTVVALDAGIDSWNALR